MIILEGFAYGVPVITTPVAAITEVVDHERNGLLVPVGDIEALAAALRRLIEDPELRLRLGRAAREDHARAYDIRGYAARLVNLWREVAANRKWSPSESQGTTRYRGLEGTVQTAPKA
jgi:glycosyltransferase involved in cell wall biosynthesis